MTTFDPQKYKETTRRQWQEAADAWHRWGPTLRAWLGPCTERMLDMAKIGPGARVLDFAAQEARKQGLDNVATRVLDGELLDVPAGSFDAVISRVGLIYFPDQQ